MRWTCLQRKAAIILFLLCPVGNRCPNLLWSFWLRSLEESTLETKSFLLPYYLQKDLLGLNLNNFEVITGSDDVRFICSNGLNDCFRWRVRRARQDRTDEAIQFCRARRCPP